MGIGLSLFEGGFGTPEMRWIGETVCFVYQNDNAPSDFSCTTPWDLVVSGIGNELSAAATRALQLSHSFGLRHQIYRRKLEIRDVSDSVGHSPVCAVSQRGNSYPATRSFIMGMGYKINASRKWFSWVDVSMQITF